MNQEKPTKTQWEEYGIKIEKYDMISHVAFKDGYAMKHSGTFKCEGKPLHEKMFIKEFIIELDSVEINETISECFYLVENLIEDDAPIFKNLLDLIKHYNSESK